MGSNQKATIKQYIYEKVTGKYKIVRLGEPHTSTTSSYTQLIIRVYSEKTYLMFSWETVWFETLHFLSPKGERNNGHILDRPLVSVNSSNSIAQTYLHLNMCSTYTSYAGYQPPTIHKLQRECVWYKVELNSILIFVAQMCHTWCMYLVVYLVYQVRDIITLIYALCVYKCAHVDAIAYIWLFNFIYLILKIKLLFGLPYNVVFQKCFFTLTMNLLYELLVILG